MLDCFTSGDDSTFNTVFFFLNRCYMITIVEKLEPKKADDGTVLIYVLLSGIFITFFFSP